jgi:very-short-patch-repair endonuclease
VRLAVELDGRNHDERQAYDRRRTSDLQREAVRVVRYSNDDVWEDVDAVAEAIAREAWWMARGR